MTDALRSALPAIQFWQLELHLWAAAALTLWQLPALARSLAVPARAWIVVAAIASLAAALAAGAAPRTSRIFYDEQIYQHIGQSLADRHRAEMCNEGAVGNGRLECARPEYNKQPNGYPHLLSVGYRLAGTGDRLAWIVNNTAAVLLPVVVFVTLVLLSTEVSRPPGLQASLFAALIAALIPHQLLWANTAAAEPTAALAIACAVMTAAWFTRAQTTGALLWMVVATSYACQFRPESPLVVPLVAAIVVTRAPGELRRPRTAAALGIGLVLALPLAAHVWAIRDQGWGTAGPRFSIDYVRSNVAVNGPFYVSNVRFPALYTALAAAAIVAFVRHAWARMLAAYFLLFFGVYLVFYAGSYDYGADVRYSLMTYPPMAMLAGAGAALAAARLGRYGPAIVAGVLLAQFTWFLPLVRAVGEEAWAARADVDAAREFSALVPENAVVLTHNPSMFLLWGVNAAQMSIAVQEDGFVAGRLAPRFSGGVYFHWNFWCNVPDPVQAAFCTTFQEKFATDLVAERRERTYRYALYRVQAARVASGFRPAKAPPDASRGEVRRQAR